MIQDIVNEVADPLHREIERLRKDRQTLLIEAKNWRDEIDRLTGEFEAGLAREDEMRALLAALRRELAEARRDAERYQWLKKNATDIKFQDRHVVSPTLYCLDAAIDAAMKEGER
jgi:predicted  nucleic acid-binding Zn-ribbon protein